MNNTIHFPTPEEEKAQLERFFAIQRSIQAERRAACRAALPALERLAGIMQHRSGQCFKVRALLYSMWNGKPAPLNELLGLDWEIRKDMVAVMLAFGYEDAEIKFFYDAIKSAVTRARQWNWFLEEIDNIELLEEYVKAGKERS